MPINYFKNFTKNPPLSSEMIQKIISGVNYSFPNGYIDIFEYMNGGDGMIGRYSYLILWKLDELTEANENYEVDEYAKGFVIFGSDGGGTAYAFQKENGNIVSFPFIGMIDEGINFISSNFAGFLDKLENVDYEENST